MADRRLQVFHTVARLLSFTKAAETLHMTQPAVTFQIRQREGEFKEKHPGINIRLKVSNSVGIVHMVEDNSVDVGIVESPIANKNLVVEVCWYDKLVFICPPQHPLAKKSKITAEDLLGLPFVCREEGSGTREFICEYLEANGMPISDLDLSLEVGNPEAVKSAVEAGLGVSIVSQATGIKEPKTK